MHPYCTVSCFLTVTLVQPLSTSVIRFRVVLTALVLEETSYMY